MKDENAFLHYLAAELANAGVNRVAELVAEIRERAQQITPIAYHGHDLSCGLSTGGILICGDRASISAVKSLLDEVEGLRPYPALLREAQKGTLTITYRTEVESQHEAGQWVRFGSYVHKLEDAQCRVRSHPTRHVRIVKRVERVSEEIVS